MLATQERLRVPSKGHCEDFATNTVLPPVRRETEARERLLYDFVAIAESRGPPAFLTVARLYVIRGEMEYLVVKTIRQVEVAESLRETNALEQRFSPEPDAVIDG